MSGPMYSAPPIELYQFLLQYLVDKFPSKCESKTIGGKKSYTKQNSSMSRGCSSVVERMLCMYEAPSSILGISTYFTSLFPTELFDQKLACCPIEEKVRVIKHDVSSTFDTLASQFGHNYFLVHPAISSVSLYSSVAEHWSCKPGVESSILSGGSELIIKLVKQTSTNFLTYLSTSRKKRSIVLGRERGVPQGLTQ